VNSENRYMKPATDSTDECPKCKGTGWYSYLKDAPDDYPLGPDGKKMKLIYADRCDCNYRQRNETYTDQTGVPSIYRDADLNKFNFKTYRNTDVSERMYKIIWNFWREFEEWKTQGKGLYLWSKSPGSGKTYLASCIGKSLMMKYDLQMRFITVTDYLNLVAESFKRDRGDYDQSSVYRTCRILVLDDIGTQPSKEWYENELFRLIDYRLKESLITIYTSNFPVEELNVADRLIDRICSTSISIHFPEENIRQSKNREKQDKFLIERGINV